MQGTNPLWAMQTECSGITTTLIEKLSVDESLVGTKKKKQYHAVFVQ
jgi:hypothetical protein